MKFPPVVGKSSETARCLYAVKRYFGRIREYFPFAHSVKIIFSVPLQTVFQNIKSTIYTLC